MLPFVTSARLSGRMRLVIAGATLLVLAAGCRTTRNMTAAGPSENSGSQQSDPAHVGDVTVRVSPQPVDLRVATDPVSGTIAVQWPESARVALVAPGPIPLALPDSPLKVNGTVGVDWPKDLKLSLVSPESIRLALPSDPLKAHVTLTGPDVIRLAGPAEGLRARLESDVLVAKLQTDGALDDLALHVKFDAAQLKDAKIGVNWGNPPAVPIAMTVFPTDTRNVPPATTRDYGWLVVALLLAPALALTVRFLIPRTGRASAAERRDERLRVDQVLLAILAPWFVPMFLDMLGKTVMRDVGQNAGQWLVFFSYCVVASTLGAEFIAPVLSGFKRLLNGPHPDGSRDGASRVRPGVAGGPPPDFYARS
jgi:hypothetical protein